MEIFSKTDIHVNNKRVLTKPVKYKGITIPTGFEWDGASVPKSVSWFMPKWGVANLASLVHDFLYSKESSGTSRREADNVFYTILLELGMSTWKAYVLYTSVRLLGGSSYKVKGMRI